MSREKSKTMPMHAHFFFFGGGGGDKRGILWNLCNYRIGLVTLYMYGINYVGRQVSGTFKTKEG